MKKILFLMAIALSFIVISCSDNKDEPEPSKDHEYVDLGLPSGTLWATYNVGANTPEGYGDYFTWGETKPKDVYDMASNKWFSLCHDSIGTYWKVMKYNSISSVGVVDNKTELDPEDDAAYVNWGASWRMPTLAQQKELIRFCKWKWTTMNGVNGRLVTGPNGKTMFLPAAGFHEDSLFVSGTTSYWSRTLADSYLYSAYCLVSDSVEVDYWNVIIRWVGMPVRAVRVSQN